MANQRALEMYKAYNAAAEKLDYFMIGLSAASLAYVVQQYKPHRLEHAVDYLEPLSMILLLASIYYGLQRAESFVEASRYNFLVLEANEQKAAATKATMPGTESSIHIPGRTLRTVRDLEAFIEEQIVSGAEATKRRDHYNNLGLSHYKRRNLSLLTAMTLLAAHRLLAPYFG